MGYVRATGARCWRGAGLQQAVGWQQGEAGGMMVLAERACAAQGLAACPRALAAPM